MFRNLARVAMTVAMLAAPVALAGPAQAAQSDCPSQYFCLWTNTNYTGSRFQWPQTTFNIAPNTGIRLGSGVSNRGYSFYNHTTRVVFIYDSVDCNRVPWYRSMMAGQAATAQGSDWGGRVSSIGQSQSLLGC